MAVMTPRVRWGSREVDWTGVPDSSAEIASTARRLFAEGFGVLGFTFVAGSAIAINSVSGGGLGLLGMAAATAVGYAIMVLLFHPICGALLLNLIFDDVLDNASKVAALSFHDNMGFWTGGLLEAILTFALVVVYFRAFVDPRGDRSLGALGLGLVAFFGFLIAYPLTGGAMNLARVFGTDLVANQWTDFGAFWLGLIGGAVAGLAYEYLFAHREEE